MGTALYTCDKRIVKNLRFLMSLKIPVSVLKVNCSLVLTVFFVSFSTLFLLFLIKRKVSKRRKLSKFNSHNISCHVVLLTGGGGGGFKSSGRSSIYFGGTKGTGGEGGKGFLQGGVGGRPYVYNGDGGFGGGGGAYGSGGGAGGGGGYSGGASGDNYNQSCGGGGGSYNAGKNQDNTVGYQANGHGFVQINRLISK